MLEGVEEVQAVGVVLEDRLLLIAARSDMINRAGVFDAEGAGHAPNITQDRL
jgi:hypothetical protein